MQVKSQCVIGIQLGSNVQSSFFRINGCFYFPVKTSHPWSSLRSKKIAPTFFYNCLERTSTKSTGMPFVSNTMLLTSKKGHWIETERNHCSLTELNVTVGEIIFADNIEKQVSIKMALNLSLCFVVCRLSFVVLNEHKGSSMNKFGILNANFWVFHMPKLTTKKAILFEILKARNCI